MSTAFIEKNEARLSIGNRYIVRHFSIRDGHLSTDSIVNRRTDGGETPLCPAHGSEEFIVSVFGAFGMKRKIRSSALTVADVEIEDGEAKRAVFTFKPFIFGKATYTFRETVVLKADDHFMRKYIEFSVPDSDADRVKIDYIDCEYIALGRDVKQRWSRPDMQKAFLNGFQAALGQPIYLNGMFTGAELPVTDNNIEQNTAHIRYYSGKTFRQLKKQENGFFKTWNTVFGAARSFDMAVIKADFLSYLSTIQTNLYLRMQYNSWYDHMLDITAENIEGSFYEIERGLTQHGVKPLHSYVVDDGWNDYDKDFWQFNKKFPNELYDSSALARKFGSEFGLWLGPRGGYDGNETKFSRNVASGGKGGRNSVSKDICVAHPEYIETMGDFFCDYMDKFDINYWKLDGFMLNSCKDKTHGHVTGGYKGMYCFTEMWESWIGIFEKMRAHRAAQGKPLWINQTSYCNASPWYLQWSESLWMQNSSDIGHLRKTNKGKDLGGSDCDATLSYRDERYFNMFAERQYQIPNAGIYNHDPIYGNSANIKMTDNDFRKFMYMIATRGTAFWELYYSYNLFTEDMWRINADVLRWVEDNFHILRHSRLIGRTPAEGKVYGYSAWDGAEGIVSVRNPAKERQTFTLTLDRLAGVDESARNLSRTTVLPYTAGVCETDYSYGDSLTVTLEPHEIKIYRFGRPETNAPVLQYAKMTDSKTAELTFDKRIAISDGSFGGAQGTLNADYRSATVTLNAALQNGESYALPFTVQDIFGNAVSDEVTLTYYENDEIPVSEGFSGKGDFTVQCGVDTDETDCVLVSQGEEIKLGLQNGCPVFTCMGVSAVSKTVLPTGSPVKLTAVREKNGMVKLYIDGKLDCSGYDGENILPAVQKNAVVQRSCVLDCRLLNKALTFKEA